ncbi:MAG: AAA family ATPase [Acidobacteriota bacterium]
MSDPNFQSRDELLQAHQPEPAAPISWAEANRRALLAELEQVLEWVEALRPAAPDGSPSESSREAAAGLGEVPEGSFAVDWLVDRFALSPFERALVVLAAGVELEARVAQACAQAQGDSSLAYATFGLALAALPHSHWSALSPSRPLRRWQLIEMPSDGPLTARRLTLAERVLHYLLGEQRLDSELELVMSAVPSGLPLPPSQGRLARRLGALLELGEPAILQLLGPLDQARSVAAEAVEGVELQLFSLPVAAVPALGADLDRFCRLWEREALLGPAVPLLEVDAEGSAQATALAAAARLAEALPGAVLVAGSKPLPVSRRPLLTYSVEVPPFAERRELWQQTLAEPGGRGELLEDRELDDLAATFAIGGEQIRACASDARAQEELAQEERALEEVNRDSARVPEPWAQRLRSVCRRQVRPRLEALAQRIEVRSRFEDLVLPTAQTQRLRQLADHAAGRVQVLERWGFGAKGRRGLGTSALFAGPSGTGKTLAAEVVAQALDLDLYRIDLASVVSKYIGETEKNLKQIFDAAEAGGALLLFDEADALFGKRSEVRDSHDRYANIEVGYLLQRMESFDGVAVLTTNLKDSMDSAFTRRLRFIVDFPFPEASARERIWRRSFPSQTPLENIDFQRLARLDVTGGHIRNMALNAAYRAAAAGSAVTMGTILGAAKDEYAKLRRTLTREEVQGW